MPTVLLVEDDADLLEVTAFVLRREGYTVVTATDGVQALSRWQADALDLILLDISLPRLSGFEVCRQIREQSTIPIILLTALAQQEQIDRGLALGANDFVVKPFSYTQLAARIRAVLAHAAGEPPPAAG